MQAIVARKCYKAMQGDIMQCKQCKAIQGNATQCKTMQGKCKTMHGILGNAKQYKAMQSNAGMAMFLRESRNVELLSLFMLHTPDRNLLPRSSKILPLIDACLIMPHHTQLQTSSSVVLIKLFTGTNTLSWGGGGGWSQIAGIIILLFE